MSTPQSGIEYDAEAVLPRAYRRIAELTMQLDQLTVAYEMQSLELLRAREDAAQDRDRGADVPPRPTGQEPMRVAPVTS